MLGLTDKLGEGLGLSNDWAVNVIKAVGNYGEIFDRNVGSKTPLALARGLNDLWTQRRPAIRTARPLGEHTKSSARFPKNRALALCPTPIGRSNRLGAVGND